MQGGDDAIGDYPGAETTGSGFGDPTIKDQLYLFGPPDIQVLADYILEENSPADRTIQNLGEGQFDLQNRNLVSVSRLPVARGKGMRQAAQPFAEERIDLAGG